MIVEYVDLLKSSYTLTLSYVMINCNCFNDWDYSLFVLNEVSNSYFALWIDYYLTIRNHMRISIYVAVIRMIMMPSCPYFILSTPLSLNMWTYFSILASAWGQARPKLGGVDTSILHHRYLLHYGLLLHIMSQYLCLFSLILQGLHKEGECRQLEFWAGKGANIRDLFCTTPKVLKLHESHFWN